VFDTVFPYILQTSGDHAFENFRSVVVLLHGEPVIYGWPDPPEPDRPDRPYAMLAELSDDGKGRAFVGNASILSTDQPDPDLRQTLYQAREKLVRVWCYGAAAMARASRIVAGIATPSALALMDGIGVRALRHQVEDASRTIGQHHERVAYADFLIRYRLTISEDIYSIKTASAGLTVT
jgi:hypothetical protein